MIKLLSLFSGIGAFEKALDRTGNKYELVNYCDIDKYASKSYAAVHGVSEEKNLWDITKVDTSKLPKDIDLITYGFPCQDISIAGRQRGFESEGKLTRSGLFFEALRIIEDCKPKYAIAENVKNLTGKKFKNEFHIVLTSLEEAGYNNYWKVLNARDFGVPQNRERVFIVSIRKDIDDGTFQFPEGFPLTIRLKDVLEDEADEKYYLSEKIQERFKVTDETMSRNVIGTTLGEENTRLGERDAVYQKNGIIEALAATDYKQPKQIAEPKLVQVAQIYPNSGNPQAGRIYSGDGISPAMDTCSGGNRMPKIYVKEATKKGFAEAELGDSINLEQPNSKTRRGRVGHQVAQTLTTSCNLAVIEEQK